MTQTMELNGRMPAVKPKPRKPAKAPRSGPRKWLTVGTGCGVPVFSLAMSSIGGRLITSGYMVLGAGAMGLCCTVLAVSLSHLAWALKDVTRCARWQSWCLAVAIDLSLVLCELAGVAGFSLWVVPCVMAAVTVTSAALNCWAFLRG